jgi:hypothetical protein
MLFYSVPVIISEISILGLLGIFQSVIFFPRLLFSLSAVGECAEGR